MCGETFITITNEAQFFEWEGFGLRVHIEEFSLPEGVKEMSLSINASTTGHYESPEDHDRVSVVYWFKCEPNIKLEKEVILEVQHCAIFGHTSELSFARAVCTQEKLPYFFKLLKGGQFNDQSSYGVLSLSQFSGIAAFMKKFVSLVSVKRYYASLFHQIKESRHEIHVVVTWNTEAHLEVSLMTLFLYNSLKLVLLMIILL